MPRNVTSPSVTRRTALAVGLTALAAGCTSRADRRAGSARAVGQSSGPTPRPASPDVRLAVEALAAVSAAAQEIAHATHRHHHLRALLEPVLATHRAHAAVLDGAVPAGAPSAPSPSGRRLPRSARAVLPAVVALEQDTAATLRRQALAARSGSFARLLAGMSAGCAQQAAVVHGRDHDRHHRGGR